MPCATGSSRARSTGATATCRRPPLPADRPPHRQRAAGPGTSSAELISKRGLGAELCPSTSRLTLTARWSSSCLGSTLATAPSPLEELDVDLDGRREHVVRWPLRRARSCAGAGFERASPGVAPRPERTACRSCRSCSGNRWSRDGSSRNSTISASFAVSVRNGSCTTVRRSSREDPCAACRRSQVRHDGGCWRQDHQPPSAADRTRSSSASPACC